MFRFMRKLFRREREVRAEPEDPSVLEGKLDRELAALRERVDSFLVTRSVESGLVKKTEGYTLTKNHAGLYRLEAEGCSVLVATEPFLTLREKRVTGLLVMSETNLCRALEKGRLVGDFLPYSLPLHGKSREISRFLRKSGKGESDIEISLEDLSGWEPFDVQQVVARSGLNTLAHVLVHSPPDCERAIRRNISRGLKRMLLLELESLAVSVSHPHSQVRALLDFEDALREFRSVMKKHLESKKIKKI